MTQEHRSADESRRHVIVVAGMHRSGTSALAGILHQLGGTLPRHLIPANPNNPRGYFESEVLYPLHDQLLRDAGSGWSELRGPSRSWFESEAATQWVDRLAEVSDSEFPDAEVLVFKDPRLCRLLPIWKRVFEQRGIEPYYLIPIRNPLDVARSLQKANRIPVASGFLLWLDYFLTAERDTRSDRRGFFHFDALRKGWRAEIARACEQAQLSVPVPDRETEASINNFLGQNSSTAQPDLDEELTLEHPWIETAYREAVRGCGNGIPNPDALDEICVALETAEAAMGPSVAAMEVQLQTEQARRLDLEAQLSSLREERSNRANKQAELQTRLAQRREEVRSLGKTVEMLMRWVLERTRDEDKPASPELRASLAAIEKAEPAAIPQIASTAALLAEKNVQLANHERERASRAALIVEAGERVARAARELAEAKQRAARSEEARAGQDLQVGKLRGQLESAEAQLRIERARMVEATAQRERLSQTLDEQIEATQTSWFRRVMKGFGL